MHGTFWWWFQAATASVARRLSTVPPVSSTRGDARLSGMQRDKLVECVTKFLFVFLAYAVGFPWAKLNDLQICVGRVTEPCFKPPPVFGTKIQGRENPTKSIALNANSRFNYKWINPESPAVQPRRTTPTNTTVPIFG